jgi:hypothetical protein
MWPRLFSVILWYIYFIVKFVLIGINKDKHISDLIMRSFLRDPRPADLNRDSQPGA